MIKALIIDDLEQARTTLKKDLSIYAKDIEVIGEAEGVVSGAKLLRTVQPDILFLDIQMQDGSGFDLLDILPEINFKIIFITASDAHAIKVSATRVDSAELKATETEAIETVKPKGGTAKRRTLLLKIGAAVLLAGALSAAIAVPLATSGGGLGYDEGVPVLLTPFESCSHLSTSLQLWPGYFADEELQLSARYSSSGFRAMPMEAMSATVSATPTPWYEFPSRVSRPEKALPSASSAAATLPEWPTLYCGMQSRSTADTIAAGARTTPRCSRTVSRASSCGEGGKARR